MFITLFLFIIFAFSIGMLWYRISRMLPQLASIPDEVITERLHEESAKLRLVLIHLKSFLKEKRHWDFFWNFVAKTLYKTHILLLRIDNAAVVYMRKIREEGRVVNINADYWKQLGQHVSDEAQEIMDPDPSILSKNERVEEIRPKR